MDPVQGNYGGPPGEPSAAPPDGAVVEPQYQPQPLGYGAPPEPGAPDQPYPSTEDGAQPDWTTRVSAAEERAQRAEREASQFRQAWGEMQGMFAQAQAEQQRIKAQSEAEARIEAAHQRAGDMDPESAQMHLRQAYAYELAQAARRVEETEAQAQARLEATVAQIALPQYVRERGQELGLPPKYVEMLEGVPAHLVDAVLPFVKFTAEQAQNFGQNVEQIGRSVGAAQMAQSGAFNSGGNGATPARPGDERFDPNSDKYDSLATISNILGRLRGGR